MTFSGHHGENLRPELRRLHSPLVSQLSTDTRQDKTNVLPCTSQQTAINTRKKKTKFIHVSTNNREEITLKGSIIKEVEAFTYIGSIVDKHLAI